MRLLVTGRTGQVARALIERAPVFGAELVNIGRPECDLACPGDLTPLFAALRPDVIVNAAAYTAVDKAEAERDAAFAVNAVGAGAVAKAAAALRTPVIHLSTDYVFDGTKSGRWVETDIATPLGVYGASKLAGEEAVLSSGARAVILRVAWIHAPFGSNFVSAMLRLAETRDRIGVVSDQIGAPTSALDIADGIFAVAANLDGRTANDDLLGVFHMGASGPDASWADFAETIFAQLVRRGARRPVVDRITSAAYSAVAKRPANSRLDSTKLARVHGVVLPDWRESLGPVLDRLAAGRAP